MNTFFKSQFSYSLLTWMMHSRKRNDKINRLHERYLRVTYNDGLSSFKQQLETGNSVSVHNRNFQCLYKVFISIYPDIMKDVLLVFVNVWELFPNNIKSLENLPKFKKTKKLETCCMPLQVLQTLHFTSHFCVVCVVLTFNFKL